MLHFHILPSIPDGTVFHMRFLEDLDKYVHRKLDASNPKLSNLQKVKYFISLAESNAGPTKVSSKTFTSFSGARSSL